MREKKEKDKSRKYKIIGFDFGIVKNRRTIDIHTYSCIFLDD